MNDDVFNQHCNEQRTERSGCPFTGLDLDGDARAIALEINSQIVTQAGMWGRALLLQLAHPLVAYAVARHGRLLTDPSSGQERLLRTVETIYTLMLGSPEDAGRVARRLHHIHTGVRGRVPGCGGALRADTDYRAHNPELLKWVYATLVDSALISHQRFVRPLSSDEQDAYCRASRRLGLLVGMSGEDIPESAREIRAYIDEMLSSPEITVTDPARQLVDSMFGASLPAPMRPLRALAKLTALADLPPSLRSDYGFQWTRSHRLQLAATTVIIPIVQKGFPSVPTALRFVCRSRDEPTGGGYLHRSLARL